MIHWQFFFYHFYIYYRLLIPSQYTYSKTTTVLIALDNMKLRKGNKIISLRSPKGQLKNWYFSFKQHEFRCRIVSNRKQFFKVLFRSSALHYSDVIMSAVVSQITSLMIVSSTVYSGADQRKHQSSASLAFVRGIHRWPVNSPHKGPVTRKKFPFDDVIMRRPKFLHCACRCPSI